MKAIIKMTSGIASGDFRILTEGATHLLGRSSMADWRVEDECISRLQCVFWVRNKQVYVRDLHSRNGTFVNGDPLVPGDRKHFENPLQTDHCWNPGEELHVGDVIFQLALEEQPDAERPALKIKVRGGTLPLVQPTVHTVQEAAVTPRPRISETVVYETRANRTVDLNAVGENLK